MCMHRKQQRTPLKIQKELERELSHREWLEQNLNNTDLLRQSRRRVLEKTETQISKRN